MKLPTDLFTVTRTGDTLDLKLTLLGRLVIDDLCLLLPTPDDVAIAPMGPRGDQSDPLAALEEEHVAATVAVAATLRARSDAHVAAAVLQQLRDTRRAHVSTDDMFSLAAVANGAYARYRSADLDAAGASLDVGAPGAVDVDAALEELLGPQPTGRPSPRLEDAPWSPQSQLCLILSQQALAAAVD